MSRILVVYYSRSGTVREVADRIASALDADLDEIVDRTPRTGVVGALRSGFEAVRRHVPPIAPSGRDPSDYQLVVIGSPVWAASLASPVRTYLRRHHRAFRSAAFFCTCSGSGSKQLFAQMEEAAGVEPLARMKLRDDEIQTVTASLAIERFATELRAGLAHPVHVHPSGVLRRPGAEPRPDPGGNSPH